MMKVITVMHLTLQMFLNSKAQQYRYVAQIVQKKPLVVFVVYISAFLTLKDQGNLFELAASVNISVH